MSKSIRARLLAACAASILVAGVLSGCSILGLDSAVCDRSHAQNIGFVIGHHANAPLPQVVPSLEKIIDDAIRSNGQYVTISADGQPFEYDHNYLGSSVTDGNQLCQTYQDDAIAAFPDALAKTPALTKEADQLTALGLAARGIVKMSGENSIVVIDNGLQTVAPLDFATGQALYGSTPQEIADAVKVPDELSGMTVYWSGMGDTMPPQVPLTLEARQLLIDIWTAILKKAGAKLVLLTEPLPPVDPAVTTTVSVVDVEPVEGLPQPIQLTEDSVRFDPDRATFADPDRANAVLKELADRINAAPSAGTITITGTTARYGSEDINIDLSKQRAEAVKTALMQLGVPAARLKTDGLGSQWKCYVPDDDAANRRVIITSALQSPEDICG